MSWWFEKTENSIFLMINGERARNPRSNAEYEEVESIRSGRSAEEIWITFRNQGSSGRRILRSQFQKENEFSQKINDENNTTFIVDFYKNCNLKRSEVRKERRKRKSNSEVHEPVYESQLHVVLPSSTYNENLIGEYEINVNRILRPPKEYTCRTIKEGWVSTIEMALRAMPVVNTVIPVMVACDEQQDGNYCSEESDAQWYYSLGGNHLCEAISRILKNDMNDSYASLRKVKARVYRPMKSHDARHIGNIHNAHIQSMPLTFQDKVWQARLLAKELPEEANIRENIKKLLDDLYGMHNKSKDSLSTIISVVKYSDTNFDKFRTLVEKHELENGAQKSIPQKLFRILQGLNNETDICRALQMAAESSLEKASETIKKEKQRRDLKDMFVSQTNSLSWDDARQTFPHHAELLDDYTDLNLKRGSVPDKIITLCKDAMSNKIHQRKKMKIDVIIKDEEGKELIFSDKERATNIIFKFKEKLIRELQSLPTLSQDKNSDNEDDEEECITFIPETQQSES